MKPQFQRYIHREEEGQFGDCHRTCLAMILDMDRDDVPHFMDNVPANSPADSPECIAAEQAERDWLATKGLTPVYVAYDGSNSLQSVLDVLSVGVRDAAVILGCTSSNGCNHSVVFYSGKIFNPNGSSISGPMCDGLWWVTIISVATKPLPVEPLTATVGTQEDDQ